MKIAVIGLPTAGKTTLIAMLFETIARGDLIVGTRLMGSKTIDRVNRFFVLLRSGRPFEPTQEADTFLFRFNYVKRRAFSPVFDTTYDVEVADFPGEYSEQILNSPNSTDEIKEIPPYVDSLPDLSLLTKEYFSWIATARQYVFVIDLSAIFASSYPRGYVSLMIARIRASWQIIEDSVSDIGFSKISSRSVRLVFSKLDCVDGFSKEALEALLSSNDEGQVLNGSSSAEIRSNKEIIKNAANMKGKASLQRRDFTVTEVSKMCEVEFQDLIVFFRGRTKDIEIHYTSVSEEVGSNHRFGVHRLLLSMLPN